MSSSAANGSTGYHPLCNGNEALAREKSAATRRRYSQASYEHESWHRMSKAGIWRTVLNRTARALARFTRLDENGAHPPVNATIGPQTSNEPLNRSTDNTATGVDTAVPPPRSAIGKHMDADEAMEHTSAPAAAKFMIFCGFWARHIHFYHLLCFKSSVILEASPPSPEYAFLRENYL